MSGTVPPPPPPPSGPDERPDVAGSRPDEVRRVASAYRRPAPSDPAVDDVPQQQTTAASAPLGASATTAHAPVPPAPEPFAHAPVPPEPQAAPQPRPAGPRPVDQPTQQLPPVVPPGQGWDAATTAPQAPAQPAYAQQQYAQQGYPAQQQYAQQPQQYAQQQYAQQQQPLLAGMGAAAAPARARRRLSPGWILFIVVDAVLVVMVVAFAWQIFSSDSPPLTADAPAAASSPSAPASPTQDSEGASGAGAKLATFASPSGNISCKVFERSASCGIAELNQQPAPVEGCNGTTGYVVTVDDSGKVALPCVAAADQPKAAGKKAKVLSYGSSITEGDFTCTSDENGMSCQHDPSGGGFSLARAGIGTN